MTRAHLHHGHRFPPEVIAHAVWLFFRFPLSLRVVEDLLAERGIIVSHQTVRAWAEKFGREFGGNIRRRSTGLSDGKWHLVIEKSGANAAGLDNMNWHCQVV